MTKVDILLYNIINFITVRRSANYPVLEHTFFGTSRINKVIITSHNMFGHQLSSHCSEKG